MNTHLLFLPDNRFPWHRRRAAFPAARPRAAAAAVAVSVLAVMGVAVGGPTKATALGPLSRVLHTSSAVATASVPHTPIARIATDTPTTTGLSRKFFGGGDVSIEDQRYVRVTDNGRCPVNFRVTDLTFRSTAGTIALPTDALSFDGRPCTVDGVRGLFGAAYDVSLAVLKADQREVFEAIGGHDDGAALLLLPTGWDCGEGGKGRDDEAFLFFTTATSKTAFLGAAQGQPLALLSVGSDQCFYAIGGGHEGDNDDDKDGGPDRQSSGGVRGSHSVDRGGSGGTHVAPIVGAVFGALVAVALLVGAVLCFVRRRRKATAAAGAALPPLAEGASPSADMPPEQLEEAHGGAPAPDTWTSASAEPPPSGGAPVLAAAHPGGGRRPSVPDHPGHGPSPHAGQGPPLGGGTRPDPPGSHPLAAPHPTHHPHAAPGGAPPGVPTRPAGPDAPDGGPSGDAWPPTGGASPVIDSMDGTSPLWGSNPGGPPGAAAAAAATAARPPRARPAGGGGWPAGATATPSAAPQPPPPMPDALLSTVGTDDGGGVEVGGGPWAELPPTMPLGAAPAQAIDEWLATPDGLYQSF